MSGKAYRSRFRQHFHLTRRAQLDRFEMFTFRKLGLKLVPLFAQPGVVSVALLEPGDDLGKLLLLGSLYIPSGSQPQVR